MGARPVRARPGLTRPPPLCMLSNTNIQCGKPIRGQAASPIAAWCAAAATRPTASPWRARRPVLQAMRLCLDATLVRSDPEEES